MLLMSIVAGTVALAVGALVLAVGSIIDDDAIHNPRLSVREESGA